MKPFKGYEKAKPYTDQERLPMGGYILKILDAKEVEKQWGTVLEISFDIAEGDYSGYYKENYNLQQQEDKKWKGKATVSIPKDDGSKEDDWKARAFKTMTNAFEDSNKGYHWDWNEQGLKGKIVGGIFFNKEYDIDGKTGFYTAFHSFKPVSVIREGKFRLPPDKLLKKPLSVPDGFIEVDEDDLPF